ncbi:MAG TPA: glucosidase, partial [Polyangiaceae bacterium]
MAAVDPERVRLEQARTGAAPWRKWGPYLSERQWGTVREDYSDDGSAWDYFPHDQARSRAYRWGEDGLAGFSDEKQRLCFCLGLWNGKDPILKERLFGLTNSEGNHGEDVKEYYFYLDSTPTHSYAKFLYKYPQAAYPYDDIVLTNRRRSRSEQEYELLDTGAFDGDRYFDVFVEYAKDSAEDLLIQITVCNRGPEAATLHVLPQWWFRNTWSWNAADDRPSLAGTRSAAGTSTAEARHPDLGTLELSFEREVELLFTENDTNQERLFGKANATPYVKDAIDRYVVQGQKHAVNPARRGTKLAAHYELSVPAKGQLSVRLRVRPADLRTSDAFGAGYDQVFVKRRKEADEFYATVIPSVVSEDERNMTRQALAGMLWSKQYYLFNLDDWLADHGHSPLLGRLKAKVRNSRWFHMQNDDVISMPDKWEYPWYAAWDLAFHTLALDVVDPDFAKQQLLLMLDEAYLHPNGQIPAYEWNFGDVNPPVHAFAALFSYNGEKVAKGQGDIAFLKSAFQKLVLNFAWWANRKDPQGRNVFEGGFLGLDNIGVFDRSAPLPTGGFMEQADGTAWMAMYSQQLFAMALEIAQSDASYAPLATKFLEHFFWIAGSMDRVGENQDELWDEEDGFFYDVLHLPGGEAMRLKVRS